MTNGYNTYKDNEVYISTFCGVITQISQYDRTRNEEK
jgi:hypothetical protein